MKKTLSFLLLLVAFSSFSQKDTLKNKITYSVGLQINAVHKTPLSYHLGEHFSNNLTINKGVVGGLRLGLNWRNWKITSRSSYINTELLYSLIFQNTVGEYTYYTVFFNQNSVLNSLELSRVLLIPDSKYFFEIGAGVGLNYVLPKIYQKMDLFIFEESSNEYNITSSVVNNNPKHITTQFANVFLRFYRQFGKHSVGLNMDLNDIENPFVVDLYTDKKYVFSTNETSRSLTKKFSFGINYKLTLGK